MINSHWRVLDLYLNWSNPPEEYLTWILYDQLTLRCSWLVPEMKWSTLIDVYLICSINTNFKQVLTFTYTGYLFFSFYRYNIFILRYILLTYICWKLTSAPLFIQSWRVSTFLISAASWSSWNEIKKQYINNYLIYNK